MTNPGESKQPQHTFDPEQIKLLPDAQKVEALLDDAQFALNHLTGHDYENTQAHLLDIFERDPGDEAEYSDIALTTQIGQAATEGLYEPSDAEDSSRQRFISHALGEVERYQREIEEGLTATSTDPRTSDWTEGATKYCLEGMCREQLNAGITFANDYIRETALAHLPTADLRGIVLLQNALTGDQDSYEIGIDSLKTAVATDEFGHSEVEEGIQLAIHFMDSASPDQRDVLDGLAIDMLAKMRQWMGIPGEPYYTSTYVFTAANLAVAFRDRLY